MMNLSANIFPYPYQALDNNGIIKNVNDAWIKTFGYERDEAVSYKFSQFLIGNVPSDDDILVENQTLLIKHKEGYAVACTIKAKSIDASDTHRTINHYFLQKNNEITSKNSKNFLEYTINTIETIIITTIGGNKLDWCNDNTLKTLGFASLQKLQESYNCICDVFIEDSENNYIGKTVGDLSWLHYTLQHQNRQKIKVKLQTANGQKIFSLQCNPIDFDQENRYVITMQDITQLENTLITLQEYQKKLQEKNKIYEELFENAPIAYQALDKEGRLVKVNKKWKELTHLDSGFIGKHFSTFLSRETAPTLPENFKRFQTQGYMDDAEFELVNQKTGALTPIRVYGNLSYYENGMIDHTNCLLYDLTKERTQEQELKDNFESVMQTFVNILEEKDVYTAGHSKRVATYSQEIAKRMNLNPEDCDTIFRAGNLHDIGKIVTPEAILLKPSRFDQDEFSLMKEHSNSGYTILSQMLSYKFMAKIIRHHHERYDGKGYPDGIEKDSIPLLSRIMTVADAFDAMTTNRVYKPRMSIKNAIQELENNSGTQFDPHIIPYAKEYFLTLDKIDLTASIPTDAVSRHRFAYFFKDRLTNIYNGAYLDIFLHENIETKEYKIAYIIDLHHLHIYNKVHGWEQGNVILIQLAKEIVKQSKTPMVFRVQGDKFIILCDDKLHLSTELFTLPSELLLSIKRINLEDNHIVAFEDLLPFI